MSVTIKRVAELAGVSTATVSRVLNHSLRVAPEMRERVQRIIDENDYSPNMMGRNLRQLYTRKILVTLPHASSPFFGSVLDGVEARANEYDYNVVVMATNQSAERERFALDMLVTKQVDGAVLCLPITPVEELERLSRNHPLVLACIGLDGSLVPLSNATIDAKRAIYDAVTHCLQHGRQRVALMRGIVNTSVDVVAEQGYREALRDAGIPYCASLNKIGDTGFVGEAMCADLMALPNAPDAIVTISDQLAIRCVRYLLKSGRVPGEDVDVLGFHDSPFASLFMPALSTVSQPMRQIGEAAFDLLREKIQDIHSLVKTISLPYRIIHRETTRQ